MNQYDPDPEWNRSMLHQAAQAALADRDEPFRFDSPLFQVHWLMTQKPEEPLPLDEYLTMYADEPGMIEFVTADPAIGDEKIFDVGCVSNLSVRRIA